MISEISVGNDDRKLREGPCAESFQRLKKCQNERGIQKAANALTFCVSETDLLIKCVRKNPAYFHDHNKK